MKNTPANKAHKRGEKGLKIRKSVLAAFGFLDRILASFGLRMVLMCLLWWWWSDDNDDDDDDDNDVEDDYSRFRVFGHNSPKNNFLCLKPKNELFLCKNTTFLVNKFFLGWSWNFDFFDGDDDFGDDHEDEYRCNSVNFQARTFRFCMEVDLENIE